MCEKDQNKPIFEKEKLKISKKDYQLKMKIFMEKTQNLSNLKKDVSDTVEIIENFKKKLTNLNDENFNLNSCNSREIMKHDSEIQFSDCSKIVSSDFENFEQVFFENKHKSKEEMDFKEFYKKNENLENSEDSFFFGKTISKELLNNDKLFNNDLFLKKKFLKKTKKFSDENLIKNSVNKMNIIEINEPEENFNSFNENNLFEKTKKKDQIEKFDEINIISSNKNNLFDNNKFNKNEKLDESSLLINKFSMPKGKKIIFLCFNILTN